MARHRVVFIHQPEIRTSHEILRKIIEQKPLAIDYMNAGHVAWTMGDIQKAAAPYGKSITANGNRERFLEMFRKRQGSSSQTRYSRRGHPVNAGFIITSSAPRTVSVWGVPLYYKSCPK